MELVRQLFKYDSHKRLRGFFLLCAQYVQFAKVWSDLFSTIFCRFLHNYHSKTQLSFSIKKQKINLFTCLKFWNVAFLLQSLTFRCDPLSPMVAIILRGVLFIFLGLFVSLLTNSQVYKLVENQLWTMTKRRWYLEQLNARFCQVYVFFLLEIVHKLR